jgi:hypothetical protein
MTNLTLITTITIVSALSAAGAAYYVKTEIGQEPAASAAPAATVQPALQTSEPAHPVKVANAPPAPQKITVETRIIEKEPQKNRRRIGKMSDIDNHAIIFGK